MLCAGWPPLRMMWDGMLFFAICDTTEQPVLRAQWHDSRATSRDQIRNRRGARVGWPIVDLSRTPSNSICRMAAGQRKTQVAHNSCSSRSPFAPRCASWDSWVGVLVFSPRLASADVGIFVSFASWIDRKEELHRESPCARHAHMTVFPSKPPHGRIQRKQTKIMCGTEGFSQRPLCETLRAPSHVHGRRNAREAANPPRRETK